MIYFPQYRARSSAPSGKEPGFVVIKDVFISYKAEELNEAGWVRNALESCGISCWMAPDSIVGGTSYAQEIPAAIRGCKVFVLILSERAQTSKWVPRELDQAINENKIIMPFMLENCPLRDDFSFYLTNVQRYYAYEDKMSAMEKMAKEILGILGKDGASAGYTPPRDPQPPRNPEPPRYTPPRTPHPPRSHVPPVYPNGQRSRVKPKKDWVCIAALVLGILNFGLTDSGPAVCGVAGLLAALLALAGVNRLVKCGGVRGGKGLALTGFLCGILMGFFGLAASGSTAAVIIAFVACVVLSLRFIKAFRRLRRK